MLLPKVILLMLLLNITDGTNLPNCKEIMEIFYQTEDQFYDLDCTESQKLESNVTLTYHCRSLQKKMDIFGRKYYDFGVSRTFLIRSQTRIKDRFFNQEWTAWSICKQNQQIRIRKSCTGRQDIQKQKCQSCKIGVGIWYPQIRQKS